MTDGFVCTAVFVLDSNQKELTQDHNLYSGLSKSHIQLKIIV